VSSARTSTLPRIFLIGNIAMKFVIRGLALVVAVVLLAALIGYVVFSDPPAIPATVEDDDSLPSIQIDGVTLHAKAFGREDATVAIVLHGGPGSDFRSQLPLKDLSDAYRVVFYDQRGAGLSQRLPPEALTLGTHIEELDGVAGHFSPDAPVILIGHSWGAILAAAYIGEHPDRVGRAVLIEPGFLDHAGQQAWNTRAQTLISGLYTSVGSLSNLTATFFRSLHVTEPDANARDDYFMGQMVAMFAGHPDNPYHCPGEPFDAPSLRHGATTMTAVAEQADAAQIDLIGERVGQFPNPVMLMSGECDDWLGTPLQSTHAGLFQDAQLVEIPGAGHDVVHDQPDLAVAAIKEFLTRTN